MEVREGESRGDVLREISRRKEQGGIHKEVKEMVIKSASVTDCPLCCVTPPQIQSIVIMVLPSMSQGQFLWPWFGSFLSLWSAVGLGGGHCSPRLDSPYVWGSAGYRLI